MNFFETIQNRRSIRRFLAEPVPEIIIEKAFEAAVLAPNSSNTQTWRFHWVRSLTPKQKLITACLNQSAARTAAHLIVVWADPKLWRKSLPGLIAWAKSAKAPAPVMTYYRKTVPLGYKWGPLNSLGYLKLIITTLVGFFKAVPRGPHFKRDLQEVAIKSAALACENFVLAITAQGYATCMMEGFDESRVKSLLSLSRSSRVVMVIAVGKESDRGRWGPQWRLPINEVVHKI